MNFSKKIVSCCGLSSIIILLFISGCKTGRQVPSAVYSNNYSGLASSELSTASLKNRTLTKDEAVSIALANNPEYKSSQYRADAARAEYYKELSTLSPGAAVGTGIGNNVSGVGISANYQISPDKVTNVLSANSRAKQAQLETNNYRRKLKQKVVEETNQQQKIKGLIQVYEDDEKFQNEMLEETIKKYKEGKASKADVINFQAQKLEAMDRLVQGERDYKSNSYNLAATMGMTNVELPNELTSPTTPLPMHTNNDKLYDINYYLNLAIDNRPDLEAQRAALKASRYELLGAAAKISPKANIGGSNNGLYGNVTAKIQPGRNIADINSKNSQYDIQNEELNKKWIEVVSEVKTQYTKLISAQKQSKLLKEAIEKSKHRRNIVQQLYNNGKADIAELNQAQKSYTKSLNLYNKAEANIANAKAGLNAACGI